MGGYYYLVSSLPMLDLQSEPPMTIDEFRENCVSQLSAADLALLDAVTLVPGDTDKFPAGSAPEGWRQWEICFRNRIAAHRAGHKDITDYLLPEGDWFSEIEPGIQEAFGLKNPLEREKFFDGMRWQKLDGLESGHHFDIDKLCLYKVKLMILEKWSQRQTEQGTEHLNTVLSDINESSFAKDAEQDKQEQ
jgi:hypothetical protein